VTAGPLAVVPIPDITRVDFGGRYLTALAQASSSSTQSDPVRLPDHRTLGRRPRRPTAAA
jgi:hypothetical protein